MKTYLLVTFYLGLICFIIRVIELSVVEWPQQRKPKTLGQMIAETIIGVVWMIWTGLLLWHIP